MEDRETFVHVMCPVFVVWRLLGCQGVTVGATGLADTMISEPVMPILTHTCTLSNKSAASHVHKLVSVSRLVSKAKAQTLHAQVKIREDE